MRKRLLDDVSVNELLEFRNEGYTNSQIAEKRARLGEHGCNGFVPKVRDDNENA